MWNIPPIIGQKVMLDPSYAHYNDFNRTQAKGKDGYILSVNGMNTTKWLLGASSPTLTILWENGHENVYELKAVLPIDVFKTVERVEFTNGNFLNVFNEKTRNYITERVIVKNDDIRHYDMFDKEKRLKVLEKTIEVYSNLGADNQGKESVQMKYMSTLEEIERTKRTEEVVLFLESEDTSASTPKKHQPSGGETHFDAGMFEDAIRSSTLVAPDMPYRVLRDSNLNPSDSAQVYTPYMEEAERLGRLRRTEEISRSAHLSATELLAILNDEDEDI